MQKDPKVPLPGAIPVELEAGDGVAYTNMIWHWGSNYSTSLRRTIHGGHCSIGGPLFPYVYQGGWDGDLSFIEYLPEPAAETFRRWVQLFADQRDLIESVLRAIINSDAGGFRDRLLELHPGEKGKMVCLVSLSKLANDMHPLSRPEVAGLPAAERRMKITHLRLRGQYHAPLFAGRGGHPRPAVLDTGRQAAGGHGPGRTLGAFETFSIRRQPDAGGVRGRGLYRELARRPVSGE